MDRVCIFITAHACRFRCPLCAGQLGCHAEERRAYLDQAAISDSRSENYLASRTNFLVAL